MDQLGPEFGGAYYDPENLKNAPDKPIDKLLQAPTLAQGKRYFREFDLSTINGTYRHCPLTRIGEWEPVYLVAPVEVDGIIFN